MNIFTRLSFSLWLPRVRCVNQFGLAKPVNITEKSIFQSNSRSRSRPNRSCFRSFSGTRRFDQDTHCTMIPLETVVAKLKKLAPLHHAGSWDNVGLLVEPSDSKFVLKVMLTNDLTVQVMEEAKENTVDLIVSYHPPIFAPLKRLTQKEWKERIIAECLESRIAVFSPHTSHDALKGGVNDWLISAFDIVKKSLRPVEPVQEFPQEKSHILEVTLADPSRIKEVRDQCLVTSLNDSSTLKQDKEAFKTFSVKTNSSHSNEEWKLQVTCNRSELACMLKGLALSDCKESYHVSELAKVELPTTGMGRWASLKNPISLEEAVNLVKSHLRVEHVMVAKRQYPEIKDDADAVIRSVAVCAGSGSSILKGQAGSADLLLTGEMSHHEVLDAVHRGSHVILTRHTNSERGYLNVFRDKLVTALGSSIEIIISKTDKDPLDIV